MSLLAVEAIKRVNDAGAKATVTSESCGSGRMHKVVFKFRTLSDSREFYQSLVQCGGVARYGGESQINKQKDTNSG